MDTDNNEDALINQIECSVADFFVIINDSSEEEITPHKKSMSTIVTDNLFSQLKQNGIKKLPEEKIIVNTIIDFMDIVDELSKIEIKKRTNELSDQLIDILLVKFNVNPHKKDDDEAKINADDAIINEIECSVADFFVIINDSSEKEITAYKQSMSGIVTDNLFSQLKGNGIKKLPDEKIILNTIIDFMDTIDELSKIEIKKRRNELSDKLIDILLLKFNINPHQNDDVEPKSNADEAEIRDNIVDDVRKKEDNGVSRKLISSDAHDMARNENLLKNEILTEKSRIEIELIKLLQYQQQLNHHMTIPRELCHDQQGHEDSIGPLLDLYTPPATPGPIKTYKCGVCQREGHNRTTCPINKSAASPSKFSPKIATTPKKSYRCGVCGNEGHNRTTCPLNTPASSASKSTAKTPETPKKSYYCGMCGNEGHNRTTCPLNTPASSASKSTVRVPESPRKSYNCGICGNAGHNRTTCPLNTPTSSASKSTVKTPENPKQSYRCGVCGNEGHNRTTCPLNKPAGSASKYTVPISETPKRSYRCGRCGNEGHNISSCPVLKSEISSPKPAATSTPLRSYTCGLCGGEGHNRTTCSRNSVTSITPTRAAPRCGICGGEGHNSRTCGRRETSSSSNNKPSYSPPAPVYSSYLSPVPAYSSPAPSLSGGSRSYTCGTCGGSGHNSRTCGRRETSLTSYNTPSYSYSSPAPAYSSYSSYSSPASSYSGGSRSYTCGNCGGSGHNRRTCSH